MHRLRHISLFLLSLIAIAVSTGANAQKLNDKLLNRPYADLRRWHLGFSVGLHTQDLRFTHNGFVTEQGESWFIEQPAFSPGFCVNGLVDFWFIEQPRGGDAYNKGYFAYQISPLGADVQLSRSFTMFGELGFGAQGLLQVGLRLNL